MSNPPSGPRLDLKQTQSQQLVMTQQMQQAIKLLQLSNIELSDYVDEVIAENPLLERDESTKENADEHESIDQKDTKADILEDFDAGKAMSGTGSGDGASSSTSSSGSQIDNYLENTLKQEKSLREHLYVQLNTSFDDPHDLMIGGLLIDFLDESGYLRETPEILAEKLGCDVPRIEKLLQVMKQFEPTGVFVSGLSECFKLQLEERGTLTPVKQIFLDNIELLSTHKYGALCDICGIKQDELNEILAEIKTLKPKPAADYDHFIVQTAVPDVLMRKQAREAGGGWHVELNTETLPRVLVNNEYYTTVLSQAKDKKDKSYLNEQYQSANWLTRALDQRAQTILKVGAAIIEAQNGFFLYGIEFLKPLTLREIAEEIEMHESTVSRVTTGKFIGTPRGIFELKYFFSSSIGSSEGGAELSSSAVKARIEALVNAEDPKKVLSDDALVKCLKDENIDIARRTVAKYREALNIPSSVERRRIKKAQS